MSPTFEMTPRAALRGLLASEATGGILLIVSTVAALIVANSGLGDHYRTMLHAEFLGLDVLHWVNDGLMAGFFLLIGLEIKHELLEGKLQTWPSRIAPGVAAIGGMVVPALIFVAVAGADPAALRGWAIPAATDIAFALGALSLLGSRVPASVKILLTAIAVLDDLGAVAAIAIFYTQEVSLPMLMGAGLVLAGLVAMNALGVRQLRLYLLAGLVLWVLVLLSGVHATVAGVCLAMTVPLGSGGARSAPDVSPLRRLEHGLAPFVTYAIVPIFAFANAGLDLSGIGVADLIAPLPVGIAAGLIIGKPLGILGGILLVARFGSYRREADTRPLHLLGMGVISGIGFTMSLFIGGLAFADDAERQQAMKLGILAGSFVSAALGSFVFVAAGRRPRSA